MEKVHWLERPRLLRLHGNLHLCVRENARSLAIGKARLGSDVIALGHGVRSYSGSELHESLIVHSAQRLSPCTAGAGLKLMHHRLEKPLNLGLFSGFWPGHT
jgi:hypothetical protein